MVWRMFQNTHPGFATLFDLLECLHLLVLCATQPTDDVNTNTAERFGRKAKAR